MFRIHNRDDYVHTFRAFEFFSKVAIIETTVCGRAIEETCLATPRIPALQTVELRLVAVVGGFYEYEDNWMPLPFLFSSGTDGVIIIEERKVRI